MEYENTFIVGMIVLEVASIVSILILSSLPSSILLRFLIVLCFIGFLGSMCLMVAFSSLGGAGICVSGIVALITIAIYFAATWIIFGGLHP